MMKKLYVIIVTTVLFGAFYTHSCCADSSCRSDFEKGIKYSNKGVSLVDEANYYDNLFGKEAEQGYPNNNYACGLLEKSYMHRQLSVKQFIKARDSFSSAYLNCTGENEKIAQKNKRVGQENYEQSVEKLNLTADVLNSFCDGDYSYL